MTAAEKAKIKAGYPAYTTRNPCKLGGYKEYYDDNSEILFVGSITSPQGINRGYYYAAERNQFWELVDVVHDQNFPTLKTTYKFLDLKNNLKDIDIASGVSTKLNKANTIIKFEENLKICHFAICDIIEECKFKEAGAAIDSQIDKKSIKINGTKINDILKNSKIRLIVINSQFVMDLWNTARFHTTIVPILVTSPSSANRISKDDKKTKWVSEIK